MIFYLLYLVPSPQTPEGILVCTPTPTTVLEWPHELPWLQFLQQMNGQGKDVLLH